MRKKMVKQIHIRLDAETARALNEVHIMHEMAESDIIRRAIKYFSKVMRTNYIKEHGITEREYIDNFCDKLAMEFMEKNKEEKEDDLPRD